MRIGCQESWQQAKKKLADPIIKNYTVTGKAPTTWQFFSRFSRPIGLSRIARRAPLQIWVLSHPALGVNFTAYGEPSLFPLLGLLDLPSFGSSIRTFGLALSGFPPFLSSDPASVDILSSGLFDAGERDPVGEGPAFTKLKYSIFFLGATILDKDPWKSGFVYAHGFLSMSSRYSFVVRGIRVSV